MYDYIFIACLNPIAILEYLQKFKGLKSGEDLASLVAPSSMPLTFTQ